MSNTKDGKKNGLLWFFVILLVGAALVILGLTFLKKDNGTAFNVKDVSLVESAKTSVAVSVDAKGDGLRYYYSLDGKNYIEGNSSYTFTGLKEGTTYTVYVKVVDKDGTEKISKLSVKTAGKKQEETKEEEKKEEEEAEEEQQGGYTPYYPVTPAEPEVTLGLKESSLTVNYRAEDTSYNVAVTGENYGALSCESSDETVATCSLNGAVMTVVAKPKTGKATITLTENKKDKKAYFTLTVKAELVGIEIDHSEVTKTYVEGNKLDLTNLVVTGIFTDGSEVELSASEYVSEPANGTKLMNVGTDQIKIKDKSGQFTQTFFVNVLEKSPESISVTHNPKTEYIEGEKVDLTGLEVTLTYDNGVTEVLAEGEYTVIAPEGELELGIVGANIRVEYEDLEPVMIPISVRAKKVTEISLDSQHMPKVSFYKGQTFSVGSGEIIVHYDNGKSENIAMTAEGVEVTGYNAEQLGSQTLTISYGGKTTTYPITVLDVVLNSIAITTMPTTTGYIEGQTFSFAGMIVTGYYSDGSDGVVMDWTATVNGNESYELVKGNNTIVVSYGDKSADAFTVTAAEKQLASIEITAEPTNVEYIEGQKLDLTGLEVTAHYDNGDTDIVTGYTTSPDTNTALQTTNTEVVVTYEGKTDTFEITVEAKAVTSLAVTTKPSLEGYYEGQTFSFEGMVVTATYNDGDVQPVEGWTATINGEATTTLDDGENSIVVSFGGKSAEAFVVNATAKALTSIEITAEPSKKTYTVGDKLDLTGLVVTAHYNNGDNNPITDYTTNPSVEDELEATDTEVVVSYEGFEDSFEIVVSEIPTYTVTFAVNEEGYGTLSETSVEADEGTSMTSTSNAFSVGSTNITATPTAATAEYTYAFSTWEHECGLLLTANCKVTAKFTRTANKYDVSFNLKGHGSAIEGYNDIAFGSKISAPTAPTDNDYTFDGWYKEDTLTNAWDFDNDTMPAQDLELFAKWTAKPNYTYTLKYDLNGGEGEIDDDTVTNHETSHTFTITATEPTLEGYNFLGWADANDAEAAQYTYAGAGSTTNEITLSAAGEKTIYAVWEEEGGEVVLPTYSKVEYIKSLSDGYINTGIRPDKTTKVEVKFALVSLAGKSVQFVFGSTLTSGDGYQGMQYGFSNNTDFPNNPSYRIAKTKKTAPASDTEIHTYIFDAWNKQVIFDGGTPIYEEAFGNWDESKTNTPMWLLGSNQTSSSYHSNDNIKIYSFKVYKSGELVADYQPVIRWEDEKFGFYDSVSDSFKGATRGTLTSDNILPEEDGTCYIYYDANTIDEDVVMKASVGSKLNAPELTDESGVYEFAGWYKDTNYMTEVDFDSYSVTGSDILYAKWVQAGGTVTEVEYLTSGTGGYINTGYIPTSTSVIEANYQLISMPTGSTDEQLVLGSLTSGSPEYNGYQIGFTRSAINSSKLSLRIRNQNYTTAAGWNTDRHYVKLDGVNGKITLDDDTVDTTGTWGVQPPKPIYILGTIQGSTPYIKANKLKVYSITIEDGETEMNFIPAVSADGSYGMYESVSNRFYRSANNAMTLSGAEPAESAPTHIVGGGGVLPYQK